MTNAICWLDTVSSIQQTATRELTVKRKKCSLGHSIRCKSNANVVTEWAGNVFSNSTNKYYYIPSVVSMPSVQRFNCHTGSIP